MTAHVLGACTFTWNPDRITLPESKKTVATVKTYSGSAVFQWDASIVGQPVVLEWDWMPVAQYNALRTIYLSTDAVTWNPQYLGTYSVIVEDLEGEYIEVGLDEFAYRLNVKMTLNIRSFAESE